MAVAVVGNFAWKLTSFMEAKRDCAVVRKGFVHGS